MNLNFTIKSTIVSLISVFILSACNSDSDDEQQMTPFTLNFSAMNGVEEISCSAAATDFGDNAEYSVGVRDLRFYISKVTFYNQDNEAIDITLDDNDFQLNHQEGFVGLIDLTSNETGTCDGEGTERTNNVLTGMTADTAITKVTFDIGVPQAVMKDVINTSTAEDAPSPLNEMHWSWAGGYRHFLFNFSIENTSALQGEGFLHIGSRDCGGSGLLALEDKDSCDLVNTPQVELTNFDPSVNTVIINIDELLTDLAFSTTTDTIETLSVSCHSNPAQADCSPIFTNLGLDETNGTATAAANSVVTFH